MFKWKRFYYKFKKILVFIPVVIIAIYCIKYFVNKVFLPFAHVKIEGNHRVNGELFSDLQQQHFFSINLFDLYQKIKADKWVKSVVIKRILPDAIKIELMEYIPYAVWDKKCFIDKDGYVIAEYNGQDSLLSVIGDDANLYFYQFMEGLELTQLDIIRELEYVAKRRWNITFVNGLILKLPEENVKATWLTSLEILDRYNLFDSTVSVLDMRISDKMFIKHSK